MIEIVKMEACHCSQVAALERACFSEPWSEKSILSEVSNPLSLWVVAIENGTVIGYVGSQTVLGEADMMNLAVDVPWRRKGIAERLVTELVAMLSQSGAHCLTLEVRASNSAAIALYSKLGFQQVGCRPRYYRNPREDALILRKEWTV